MKPLEMILCGWGPFREKQTVDFTQMAEGGIFLITGPTGAGKTTLFDCLTYALYGNMSGEIREKTSVRSDFADADTPTYTQLKMLHDGEQYTIYRSPEYLRPKKRGGRQAMTKEREKAILTLPDGGQMEGVTEVNRKIQQILRLDYRQFKQISMIAQGEFARLLTATPADKTKIFREIFGTAVYDRFAAALKERANLLYRDVMEYRHRMDEDVRQLDTDDPLWHELVDAGGYTYDTVSASLKELSARWQASKMQAEAVLSEKEGAAAALLEQIRQIESDNGLLGQLREVSLRREELSGRAQEIAALKERLIRAENAEGIRSKAQEVRRLEGRQAELLRQVTDRRKEIEEAKQALEGCREIYEGKERLTAWFDAKEALELADRRRKEEEKQAARLKQKLQSEQKTYLEQEAAVREEQARFYEAQTGYRRAVIGIAARLVEEGKPCPVCGSLEHPAVAAVSTDVPDEEQLNRLQKEYEAGNALLTRLMGQASATKARLEESDQRVQARLEEEKEIRRQLALFDRRIEELAGRCTKEQVQRQAERYTSLQAALGERNVRLRATQEEYEQIGAELERATAAWREARRQKGFTTDEAYREAVLDAQERRRLSDRIGSYHSEVKAAQELYSHIQKSVEGKEYQPTQKLREKLAALTEEKKRASAALAEWNLSVSSIERIKRHLEENRKDMLRLEEEYGLVRDLDNLASGNNGKKLVFEQYVLAGYFDAILEAANIRLRKMTGGRYELSRVAEVGDGRSKDNLEIRVMDYYTGKFRSVKTLSGGESFKASLSLALGMSDVIQAESGGIRVEALFVDEGFGSLDVESMDQACAVLTSLVETDRMVGIISHVPELEERIGRRIYVEKRSTGSVVRLGR